VHPHQHAKREGLSTALLCQHDVLYHVAKEYGSFVAATRQERLGIGGQSDIRGNGVCPSAEAIIGRSAGNQN
jgi:hypothetical protein